MKKSKTKGIDILVVSSKLFTEQQTDDFADELSLFCTMLADNAPLSLRGTKKILQDFVAPATWSQLDPGQARGQIAQLRMHAFRSYDHAEGRAAFVSKRKPVFEGR